MGVIRRQQNMAMVAETNKKIIRMDDEQKARSAISLALERANTEMAAAAEQAQIQARRRDLRMAKCSAKSYKLLPKNPPLVLQPSQVTEEVPQIHISPPLPGGGKAYPPPNPDDAENDARESLKRKRFLDEDDISSKNVDSTQTGNEGLDRFKNDPRFHHLKMLAKTDLDTLKVELNKLGHEAPDLLRAINHNQGEFLAIMQDIPKTHVVMKSNEKYVF